ncbi:MAG TPA: carbon-nitrogen hydrolase family protein [Candidatus Nitrosotalea sp.]|nr:carbon-nitrogen hydrolase family protein [Candidatus Nitrosotalea sp.]
MTRSHRVAAVQLRAHDRSAFVHALDGIIREARCAAEEADLVVLPEATFPAYVIGRSPVEEAPIAHALDRLREIARATQTVIVAGATARSEGNLRNAAFVIDADGSLAGRADKLFLWHFDRRWFAAGDRIEPIPTSAGMLGVLVCADGRLPTISRRLVDLGAEILVMPTAWVTSGRDPTALENAQADLLAQVRAYENRTPFVAANKCGSELGMVAYCGKSQIIDRTGEIVAIAAQHQPETIRATLALTAERPRRAEALEPPPQAPLDRSVRLAISVEPLPGDIEERLELLDDAYALAPEPDERSGRARNALPTVWAGDDLVLDPGGLVPFRRAGYALVCWATRLGAPWSERLARARALELRLYVAVFDRALRRAFAVDPDGAVVAGTFDDFRLASFTLDPRKTLESIVAPGSDIGEGLARVAKIANDARA